MKEELVNWQEKAVKNACVMSQVKWTPVAATMPTRRGGYFEKGTEYTGVPYSSAKSVGRYIGFDIFLKTFLAAVENPNSVLYTENLSSKVTNAACYYGKVCSSFTSYALQFAIFYPSFLYSPPYRKAVILVDPQSAQSAKIGDIIHTPPCPTGHVEIVTEIISNDAGEPTHIRVEESTSNTARALKREIKDFNSYISLKDRKLYRITNLDEWREENKAESFLFPNYKEDSKTEKINRVLLLDRGDWVPYKRGQIVGINIMDKDEYGVEKLVIKKGDSIVEEVEKHKKGVLERSFSSCGDYSAHCVLGDGSLSQACEFSVCDLDFRISMQALRLGKPWEINFSSDNMKVILFYLICDSNRYAINCVFVTDEDRKNGKVVIPADLIKDIGNLQIWIFGENKYGRLKKRLDVVVKK